jgi:DNA-binding protein HU-beta
VKPVDAFKDDVENVLAGFFQSRSHNNTIQPPFKPTMNKAQLIEAVQKALGKEATKKAASDALEAVLESIHKGVKKDGSVQLLGFGTFKVVKRAARTGRNPKTGATMKIAASKTVRFSPSSTLKKSL